MSTTPTTSPSPTASSTFSATTSATTSATSVSSTGLPQRLQAFCAYVPDVNALRGAPSLLTLASALNNNDDTENDSRSVRRLISLTSEFGDDPEGPARRAAFLWREWRRIGLFSKVDTPAWYFLRQFRDGPDGFEERTGFFVSSNPNGHANSVDTSDRTGKPKYQNWQDALAASSLPIHTPRRVLVYDRSRRLFRCLESELEREPNMTVTVGEWQHELWVIDDESTLARAQNFLQQAITREVRTVDSASIGSSENTNQETLWFIEEESDAGRGEPQIDIPLGLVLSS